MADSVRVQITKRIADHLAATIRALSGADYGRPPVDGTLNGKRAPYGWVFDFAERYHEDSFTHWFNDLLIGIVVRFEFRDEEHGQTIQDVGNELLAQLIESVMLLNGDPYRGELNFRVVPTNSVILEGGPGPGVGDVVIDLECNYSTPFTQQFSQ